MLATPADPREEPLTGGNVADTVVRSGDTVRKPWTRSTPAVHAFLRHLADRGFTEAQTPLGADDQGRQVLRYAEGVSSELLPPLGDAGLRRLGELVRRLHDASADFRPPPDARWTVAIPADGADLICHQDIAPWNLVRDGDDWTLIDWDAAAPGTRLWDLAYVVQTFVPLVAGGDPDADVPRVAAVVDGYRLDAGGRERLPDVLGRRTRAMYDLLGRGSRTGEMPWSRLWDEGHGRHWGGAAGYVAAHRLSWRSAVSRERTG